MHVKIAKEMLHLRELKAVSLPCHSEKGLVLSVAF